MERYVDTGWGAGFLGDGFWCGYDEDLLGIGDDFTEEYMRRQEMAGILENYGVVQGVDVSVLDLGMFMPEMSLGQAEAPAEILRGYLEGPLITDGYGARHIDRRMFYCWVGMRWGDVSAWCGGNRLKYTNVLSLSVAHRDHLDVFESLGAGEAMDRLVSELPGSDAEYNGMELSERLDCVDLLTGHASVVLGLLVEGAWEVD